MTLGRVSAANSLRPTSRLVFPAWYAIAHGAATQPPIFVVASTGARARSKFTPVVDGSRLALALPLGRDDVELILPTIVIGITANDKHPQSLAAARPQ